MIVVDTQVVLWLAEKPALLSQAANDAMANERREQRSLMISDITLREIATIVGRGRVIIKTPLGKYLAFLESIFTVLPVTAEIAERSIRFSKAYPKDPAVQLIGATAIIHDARLVTKDKLVRDSGEVNCIW